MIGIHSRWTDYSGHLQLRGGKLVKNKFYSKAIQYFRKKYKNPLFLVTSDDPGKAKTFICNPQRSFKGTYDFFKGTNLCPPEFDVFNRATLPPESANQSSDDESIGKSNF